MLKFKVYVTDEMKSKDIRILDLKGRLDNCMKRNGIKTIGDLFDKYKTMEDFGAINGLGEKSVDELMIAILDFQCSMLTDEQKNDYAKKLYDLNVNSAKAV